MKKQILSMLLISTIFLTQALPPVKDIALTSVAATGIIGGAVFGYYIGGEDKKNVHHFLKGNTLITTTEKLAATTSDKFFGMLFMSSFGALATIPFTIPFTSYYKFWKAKRTVNKMMSHDLFTQYDISQIANMDFDQLFEILNTKWDAYPLASSFDFLAEWSNKIKEAMKLYTEVKYANEQRMVECNDKIAALREINNVLALVRDRIKDSDKNEFDRQMKVFLQEKKIEELRKLERAQRFNNANASMNVHYVHNR